MSGLALLPSLHVVARALSVSVVSTGYFRLGSTPFILAVLVGQVVVLVRVIVVRVRFFTQVVLVRVLSGRLTTSALVTLRIRILVFADRVSST